MIILANIAAYASHSRARQYSRAEECVSHPVALLRFTVVVTVTGGRSRHNGVSTMRLALPSHLEFLRHSTFDL